MSELPIIIRTADDPLRFKFPGFVTTDKGQKILIQSVDIHCEVRKPMRVTITGTPLETVDDLNEKPRKMQR